MNKRQYKAALKVINNDCKIQGSMLDLHNEDGERFTVAEVCKSPATCAVGALAFAAYDWKLNAKQQTLLAVAGNSQSGYFRPFAKRIQKKFGLDQVDLEQIIEANDDIADGPRAVVRRRASVRHALKHIALGTYKLKL